MVTSGMTLMAKRRLEERQQREFLCIKTVLGLKAE